MAYHILDRVKVKLNAAAAEKNNLSHVCLPNRTARG